ncbi:MAG: Grx4 family monothiol glutaredoxin [Rhizobacter sp.]|nr:Grx4 family monothiol glutaredoxin [Burkholderiales bacterium]
MEFAQLTAQQKIENIIATNSVVLFMKGNPKFPQCGFSAAAVKMLTDAGAGEFTHVNVLEDAQIREGIKAYSSWPTIPQLYIKQEFVGGADIMRELHEAGELSRLINA